MRPTPSASARKEPRVPHSSLALAGQPLPEGVTVIVDANGKLGSIVLFGAIQGSG